MHFEIHQESGIICIRHSPRTEKSPEITNIGLSGIPARAGIGVIVADLLTAEVFTPLFICSYILKLFQECRGSLMQKSEEQILLTKPEITWELHNYLPKRHFFPYFSHMEDLRPNDY